MILNFGQTPLEIIDTPLHVSTTTNPRHISNTHPSSQCVTLGMLFHQMYYSHGGLPIESSIYHHRSRDRFHLRRTGFALCCYIHSRVVPPRRSGQASATYIRSYMSNLLSPVFFFLFFLFFGGLSGVSARRKRAKHTIYSRGRLSVCLV